MSKRRAKATALVLFAVGTTAALAAAVADEDEFGLLVGFFSFLLVGTIIIAKRPDQTIGWLFATGGLLALLGSLSEAIVSTAVSSESLGTLPARAAVWFREVYFFPAIGLMVLFPALLFPTARLLSPHWRWTTGPLGLALAAFVVDGLIAGESCVVYESGSGCLQVATKRLGIQGWQAGESPLAAIAMLVVVAGLVGAVVSVVLRFRRSHGIERAQVKWLALAVTLLALTMIAVAIADGAGVQLGGIQIFYGLALALVPTGVGIALMRYRLYEIDRIINRTVVYAVVAVLLAGLFAAGVALTTTVLPTGSSDFGVAASTLAVAGLFNPLRRRVQAAVNRRFYRTRYDPQHVAEQLSVLLRSQVNPGAVGSHWAEVATGALQPSTIGVWVRGGE